MYPAPTPAGLYPVGQFCRTVRPGSRTPCRVRIHRRKTGRETPKGSILNSLRESKYTSSWGPIPLTTGRQREQKPVGNQGPTQPWLAHRAAISTKQEKADLLTQPPTSNRQLVHQKLYIIGNKLGQRLRPVVEGQGNTPTVFPED